MAEDLASQIARLRKQIRALQDSMSSGILTVEGADGTGRVTYRSYAEMRQALSDLKQRLSALVAEEGGNVAPRRTRQVVTTGRSGW